MLIKVFNNFTPRSTFINHLSLKLAKVKRYEAKLSVLAFVGVFDEVMSSVVPVRKKLKKTGVF